MALPAGMTAKSITVGIPTRFDGSPATGSVTLTAPKNLVHTPTGTPLFSGKIVKQFSGLAQVTISGLVPTDAPGLNRYDWTYRLEVRVNGAIEQPDPINFLLLTAGPSVVDAEEFVSVPSSAGTPVTVSAVTSVAGLTGTVNGPALATALGVTAPPVTSVAGLTGAPTAAQVAAALSTPLSAAYAPLPGLTRNPLTGWFHADGLGAVADGTTNNTTVLQNAINAIIAAGGGKLYLPFTGTGVYRCDQLSIAGTGNVSLTIEGAEGVVLYAAPLATTDFLTIDSGATSTSDPFIRRVTLRNLNIQGSSNWNSGTKRPSRGVCIGQAQDIRLDNVKISQFKLGALILDDVWDSAFNDVEIKWSGYGTDSTNYAYALQVSGSLDNSNANKFKNLHMEFCPLLASFDHLARHNMFYGCKFEHGSETETNTSGKSPMYFGTSIETTFDNCFFTENKLYDSYFIRSDANADAYLSTFALRKRTTFIGCEFFAISTTKARWYSGTDTQFHRCGFQRTNGTSTGTAAYAFDFEARNALTDSQVAFADSGVQLVRFQGNDNLVRDTKVFTASSGTDGGAVTLGSSALRTQCTGLSILGGVSTTIASALTYFGNNVFENHLDPTATLTGGGAKSVFAKRSVVLNDAGAQTYTNFIHGWSGQIISVTAGTANQTVQHSANIALKAEVNLTMALGSTIMLENVNGVWRQV